MISVLDFAAIAPAVAAVALLTCHLVNRFNCPTATPTVTATSSTLEVTDIDLSHLPELPAEPVAALEVIADIDEPITCPLELDTAIALADELIAACQTVEPVAAPCSVGSAAKRWSIRELKKLASDWNRNNPAAKLRGWNRWTLNQLETELRRVGAIA